MASLPRRHCHLRKQKRRTADKGDETDEQDEPEQEVQEVLLQKDFDTVHSMLWHFGSLKMIIIMYSCTCSLSITFWGTVATSRCPFWLWALYTDWSNTEQTSSRTDRLMCDLDPLSPRFRWTGTMTSKTARGLWVMWIASPLSGELWVHLRMFINLRVRMRT